MDTSLIPSQLASLDGLTLEQIAALDITDEILQCIITVLTGTKTSAFSPAI